MVRPVVVAGVGRGQRLPEYMWSGGSQEMVRRQEAERMGENALGLGKARDSQQSRGCVFTPRRQLTVVWAVLRARSAYIVRVRV